MLTKNRRISVFATIGLVAGIVIAIVYTDPRHEGAAPLRSGNATAVDMKAAAAPGIGLRPLIVNTDTLGFQPFSIEWNYGTVRPLKDGSVLITNGTTPHWYIVAPDGTIPPTALPIPGRAEVGVSGNETLFAWPDFDGIRVYDRRDGAVRTVDSATWVSGSLVWSPDATQMAMIRVTGDNVAHLEVLDLATDSRREVFTGEAAKAIRGIRWLSPRVIEFRVMDAVDEACCPPQGGTRYEVSDVGGDARITGAPNVLWAACGPACGVPPVGYERSDGTVFWYESVPGGTSFHWGVVDRVANTVQILPGAQDSGHGELSPDGRTMAYIICNFREPQTLRLVRLSDLTVRDFVPPPIAGESRVCYNVSWFPSGNRILLHFGVPG